MNFNDFHYAMSLAETIYGVQMKEEDFEEIALVAWNLIGNNRTKIYRYKTCTYPLGNQHAIDLPCNVDILEAVTTGYEDFQRTSNTDPRSKRGSFEVEQYIETQKRNRDNLYLPGAFIDYEQVGNRLIFSRPYREVNILYKGIILDENGLPQLTDKEALALATYVAWVKKFKEGLITNNGNIINLANQLKQQWLIQCDQARIDTYYSQNDWDEILDAKTNWDRKSFRKSMKLFHG